MAMGIHGEIKERIDRMADGELFFTSDFLDITTLTTARKCLGRLVNAGTIRRVLDGLYEKPRWNQLLGEPVPVNPEKVAYALAHKYHWTIAPSSDVALNKLGLSTQVPVVWTYVSDGPYREFSWGNIIVRFRHKTNREISLMSPITILVMEALRTLGREHVDDEVIHILKNRIPEKEKQTVRREAAGVTSWMYDVIREVCA